jgi:pimeloyl-ACP methyl ester carboxylesterase/protein-tyrosine phosphatase
VPTTGFTYPNIRTFYRPHAQQSKLPTEPFPIPLLVFVHGLGGSAAQFHPILTSLVNLAPCLAIDLPGCGLSSFEPKAWNAYTQEALVRLLAVAIEEHRDRAGGQGIVLIGHSMGCSLAALLTSSSSPYAQLVSEHVLGFAAICPQAQPLNPKQVKALASATSAPALLFDCFRWWDRRGGFNSKSVLRMTGLNADDETKKLQMRFNEQSRTPVWQRMARGMIADSVGQGGLPGKNVWAGLRIPLLLLGGEADEITPAENIKTIVCFLGRDVSAIEPPSEKASMPIAAAPIDPAVIEPDLEIKQHRDSGVNAEHLPEEPSRAFDGDILAMTQSTPSLAGQTVIDADTGSSEDENVTSSKSLSPRRRHLLVKTTILPSPAAHSMVFAPSSSRIISGIFGTFLSDHIDSRLSLGWQLQYLTTEGKWDVKNLEKWTRVQPVSQTIANTFRAMKTLREVDERHSPKIFVREYAGQVHSVVDISHDSPVYDPKGLEDGGIKYYKFPTVSKLPPTVEETKDFFAIIERVQAENKGREGLIGVHCHYGFNRTGFLLVCYMIEKLGYGVVDAIDEFATARPPGIRHAHFIDALHVKYAVGLKKAPTF